jgi:hypothetical protein
VSAQRQQEATMKPRTVTALAALLAAQAHAAGGEPYQEAIGAYKNEMKLTPKEQVNTGYIADRAVSLTHRAIRRAGIGDMPGSDAAGGDINLASPTINGIVHGDVTVVVERGAIRGNVISVRR